MRGKKDTAFKEEKYNGTEEQCLQVITHKRKYSRRVLVHTLVIFKILQSYFIDNN